MDIVFIVSARFLVTMLVSSRTSQVRVKRSFQLLCLLALLLNLGGLSVSAAKLAIYPRHLGECTRKIENRAVSLATPSLAAALIVSILFPAIQSMLLWRSIKRLHPAHLASLETRLAALRDTSEKCNLGVHFLKKYIAPR